MNSGKQIRMRRLFPRGRSFVVPVDDRLISGPGQNLADLRRLTRDLVGAGVDGILGFRGMLIRVSEILDGTPFIINLTASTTGAYQTRKVAVSTVLDALKLGADAVAVHVNVTSSHEAEMLMTLGCVAQESHDAGIPLMAIMYPRTEGIFGENNYDQLRRSDPEAYARLIRHSVSIAVDLGADLVKTHYTGDGETFRAVVKCCGGVPILVAGGPRTSRAAAEESARDALLAGAAGICFGRQVFQDDDPRVIARSLSSLVHSHEHHANYN